MTFAIRELKKHHHRATFDCGNDELNHYLKQRATQDARKGFAIPYVLVEPDGADANRIIGYYTLSSYAVQTTELPETIAQKLPRYPLVPAILIGRLALDKLFQGKGFGKILLVSALKAAYRFSAQVAAYTVVVKPTHTEAANFYQKYGFQSLENSNELYLAMAAIKQL